MSSTDRINFIPPAHPVPFSKQQGKSQIAQHDNNPKYPIQTPSNGKQTRKDPSWNFAFPAGDASTQQSTLSSQHSRTSVDVTRSSSRYDHSSSPSVNGAYPDSATLESNLPSKSIDSRSTESESHGSFSERYTDTVPSAKGLSIKKPLPAYVPTSKRSPVSTPPDDGLPEQVGPRAVARESTKPQFQSFPIDKVAKTEAANVVLQNRGKRRVKIQKWQIASGMICVNFMFIFATWWWPRFYYLYLPFISLPLVLNCCMIVSVTFFAIRNRAKPEKIIMPDEPETMVLLMPCYNETLEECTKSLDSLVAQVDIDQHKQAIMVICDGRVRGPGMEKTTADYLMEDIFVDQAHRYFVRGAYTAWDDGMMDVEVTRGTYKGVPFFCIVKNQNQGKRDSLIVIRSFLYNFNRRKESPHVIFSPHFFTEMASFLLHDAGISNVTHLIGMDADTVFDTTCISELLKESRYPNTVGVCGYVAVDFEGRNWGLWSMSQSCEYTISQALRRLHQSVATHKVSCLPGCCQLLRICTTTCGDEILLQKFGYFPGPLDGMLKRIRATASEDRNHVCLMLTTFPEAQTKQALRANAFTAVPQSWSVFLSQRRRWTLGATSNDLLLVSAKGTQWWERILALSNVLTWSLNFFVIASIAAMITAFLHQPWFIILAFAGVMVIPLIYYVLIAAWLPPTLLMKAQYLLGLLIFVICGPFLNIAVLLFAVWNMDSFGWGKTRQVVSDESTASGGSVSEKEGKGENGKDSGIGSPQYSTGNENEKMAVHESEDGDRKFEWRGDERLQDDEEGQMHRVVIGRESLWQILL